MMRYWLGTLLLALGLALPSLAFAGLTLDADYVFGARAGSSDGWSELAVRIDNTDREPRRGNLEVSSTQDYGDRSTFLISAAFAVDAGGSAIVRLPIHAEGFGLTQKLVARDEGGAVLAQADLTWVPRQGPLLADLLPGSRLSVALGEVQLGLGYEPGWGSSHLQTLVVAQPKWDRRTSEPILPFRAAGFSPAMAVLIASDTLVRLQGPELEALTGYTLSGGTLAIVVKRPEDLRHPTMQALTGGEPKVQEPRRDLLLGPVPSLDAEEPGSAGHPPGSAIPERPEESGELTGRLPAYAPPSSEIIEGWSGYSGGRLAPSPFGASARHGLGEVHLLAFDPAHPTHLENAWTKNRIGELVRRAWAVRAPLVFAHGRKGEQGPVIVHRQLDPNENARWLIVATGLGLLVYSVMAGPINFSRAAKKGKPLRALLVLPILSAGSFALIFALGVVAKGMEGRARHLTLIEAGAGMERATARRFRGFFLPRARDLTVRTTSADSVLHLASTEIPTQRLVVDRDGVRLVDVIAMPWETVVVEEDGFAALGGGVSILAASDGDIVVENRIGRDLRGVFVHVPGASARYFPRIRDGESVRASSGHVTKIDGGGLLAGSRMITSLDTSALEAQLEDDVPGLGEAWRSIHMAAGRNVDWFPEDAPVVLAQLDGGEGATTDSSLKLESDRALLRVVGFGGTQ